MRRLATLLVTTVLATGLAFSVGAAPAQAEVLRGVFYERQECYRVGALGVGEGWWPSFRCSYEYNLWFLYG